MAMLNNQRVNPIKFQFPVLYPWPGRANPTGRQAKAPHLSSRHGYATWSSVTFKAIRLDKCYKVVPPKKSALCWLVFTQISSMVWSCLIYIPAYTSSVNEINPANELRHRLVWWKKTICSYDICSVLWGNIDSASQLSFNNVAQQKSKHGQGCI